MTDPRRLVRAVVIALFAVLVTYAVVFHYRFPYWDHLDLAPMLARYRDGNLTFAELFAPHGGSHWHVGAYLVLIPLASMTGWDTLWGVLVGLVLGLAIFAVLAFQLRRTAAELHEDRFLPWAALSVAFFVFSLNQAQNWIWGWQIAVFQNLLGVTLATVILCAPRVGLPGFVLALAGGLVATYDYSSGLAFWPIAAALIAIHPNLARPRKIAYAATVLAGMTAVAWHFSESVLVRSNRFGAFDVPDQLAYMLQYLGSPVARFARPSAAIAVVGAVGLVAFAALLLLLRRHRVPWFLLAPWVALACYALGSAALTSFARGHLGLQYVSFANLLWIAVFVLASLAGVRVGRGRLRVALVAGCCLVIALTTWNIARIATRVARKASERNAKMAELCARYPDLTTEEHRYVCPDHPDQSRKYLAILHARRLSLFRR
jgi:hypothetical protein